MERAMQEPAKETPGLCRVFRDPVLLGIPIQGCLNQVPALYILFKGLIFREAGDEVRRYK